MRLDISVTAQSRAMFVKALKDLASEIDTDIADSNAIVLDAEGWERDHTFTDCDDVYADNSDAKVKSIEEMLKTA